MQGTIKEFSDETRQGSVVLDDGTELSLPAQVFSKSGLRTLRPGQRVRFEAADDAVTEIGIVTL